MCAALLGPALPFAECKVGPVHKTSGLLYFAIGMFPGFHSFIRLVILSPLPFFPPPLLTLPPHTAVWCGAHSPVLCRWLAQWGSAEIQLLLPGYRH